MRSNSRSAAQGAVADRGDLERLLRLASALQEISERQGVAPKPGIVNKPARVGGVVRTKFRRP